MNGGGDRGGAAVAGQLPGPSPDSWAASPRRISERCRAVASDGIDGVRNRRLDGVEVLFLLLLPLL